MEVAPDYMLNEGKCLLVRRMAVESRRIWFCPSELLQIEFLFDLPSCCRVNMISAQILVQSLAPPPQGNHDNNSKGLRKSYLFTPRDSGFCSGDCSSYRLILLLLLLWLITTTRAGRHLNGVFKWPLYPLLACCSCVKSLFHSCCRALLIMGYLHLM